MWFCLSKSKIEHISKLYFYLILTQAKNFFIKKNRVKTQTFLLNLVSLMSK